MQQYGITSSVQSASIVHTVMHIQFTTGKDLNLKIFKVSVSFL